MTESTSPFLRRSFSHISSIGQDVEQRLWHEGYDDWQKVIDDVKNAPLGSANRDDILDTLEAHIGAYNEGNYAFFSNALGSRKAWRAFSAFESRCAYLDIETNGGNQGEAITLIGVFDGSAFKAFTKGQDIEDFPFYLEDKKMIITFYGNGFDLPMIYKRFPNLNIDQVHVDLCPTLRSLGFTGGLKKIEKQLGISRGDETDGLSGLNAISLWNRYEFQEDQDAYRLLVEYNREDVVNLQHLAHFAVRRLERLAFLGEEPVVQTSPAFRR